MRYAAHIANLDLAWQVYCSGSMRAAADAVGLSHTTLGRRIRKLESDLSMSLFIRQGRKIEPTATAKALLPKYYEQVQVLQDTLHDEQQARMQEAIRVESALIALYPALSDVLTHLRHENPLIHYGLADSSRANIRLIEARMQVVNQNTDDALCLYWSVVAHPNLRYDLIRQTLFVCSESPPFGGADLIEVERVERVPSIHDVLTAVKSQLGLGWLPMNTGLMDQTITEASCERERIPQWLTLTLQPDNENNRTHQDCRDRLHQVMQTVSDQCLTECG